MHKTVLVTAPASEPVTVSEIETHSRLLTGETTYLEGLITAARRQVERYLNRALITQTWKVFYDCWERKMELPFPPLASVTHVKYYDGNGTLQTLSSSTYYWTVTSEDPGSVVKKYDVTYPTLQDGRPDAIEIQYVAGYGDASAVPEDIKHAIKLRVTDMYENRGEVVVGTNATKIPGYLIDLLHTYKIYN